MSCASLSACLQEIKNLVQGTWGSGYRLDVLVRADLPDVRCDRLGLRDALLNLVFNARDAMPAGGTISIIAADASWRAARTEIELLVIDEGVGMMSDTMTRALDPFFTTKSGGLGGLGLPLVESIVQDAGGSLSIESSPSLGTTVTLRLPACDQP